MLRLTGLVALMLLPGVPGHAQTFVQHDRDGNPTGSITREGDSFVARDIKGHRLGSSKRDGDTVNIYDAMGNLVASSTARH